MAAPKADSLLTQSLDRMLRFSPQLFFRRPNSFRSLFGYLIPGAHYRRY